MRKPIAKIRIAAGNPGWYDSLTNIHLTLTRPESFVFEGQNTINIKKAIACKLVYLIEGSLDVRKQSDITKTTSKAVKEEVREVIPEAIKTEEVIEKVIEAKTEEVVEAVTEEKVEEEKTTKKKSSKKKKEDK